MINKNSTRAEVLAAVREDGYALSKANTKFRDDHEIVLASVSWNSESIKYASDRLKNNRKIVLKAIQDDSRNFKYASEKIRMNDKIAMSAIGSHGINLKYASKKLQNYFGIVKDAYENAGEEVLKYTSKEIRMRILKEEHLEELAWKKVVQEREAMEKFLEDVNAKSLQEWLKNNKKFIKSKETISKLIKDSELMKVLKNNFAENKRNKFNELPYAQFDLLDEINDKIFKLLIPTEVDANYFEDKIVAGKLELSEYLINNGLNVLDLLFFSSFECEPIAEFKMQNVNTSIEALFYFSIEIKNMKFLIKTICNGTSYKIIVIKQSYKKNDKNILKFILTDALRVNDDYPPWDIITLNKSIFLNFDIKEKNKFKKVWEETFRDFKPKNKKSAKSAYWNKSSLSVWTDVMDSYFSRSNKLINKLKKNSQDLNKKLCRDFIAKKDFSPKTVFDFITRTGLGDVLKLDDNLMLKYSNDKKIFLKALTNEDQNKGSLERNQIEETKQLLLMAEQKGQKKGIKSIFHNKQKLLVNLPLLAIASTELKKDIDIARAAIKSNTDNIFYIDKSLEANSKNSDNDELTKLHRDVMVENALNNEPWLDNGTVDECEHIRVYISEKPLFVPTNDKYATY